MSDSRRNRPKIKGIMDIPGIRPARKPAEGSTSTGVAQAKVMKRPSPPLEFDGPIPAMIWLLRWASAAEQTEPSEAMKTALRPHLTWAWGGGRTLETWMYALAEEMGEDPSVPARAMSNLLSGAWALLLPRSE